MIELLPKMYDGGYEGHIGWFEPRQEKLIEIISELKPVNLIEIGFNMGHSCKLICDTIVNLKKDDSDYANKEVNFYVFDICYFGFVEDNFNILQDHYKSDINLTLIKGSSLDTIRPFMEDKENIFDFIEVDGMHTKEGVLLDIIDTYNKIRKGGVIYVDDYKSTDVPCPQIEEGVSCVDWKRYKTDYIDGVFWGIKK